MPICRKYRVNLIVGRGYNSWTQVYRAVNYRFPKDGRKMIILYLGDHDPPGLHIEEKLKERVQKQAAKKGVRLELIVKRVALTYEQVEQFHLPPSTLKKKPGAKGELYKKLYGANVWELDALDPEILVKLLEVEIGALINPVAWKLKEAEVREYREKKLRPVMSEACRKLLGDDSMLKSGCTSQDCA